MDNTTFGGNIPSLPQWTGAPHAMIQVQVMLYASLAASLFSAFLAMLGKQWLNRYALTDMRGTAVERNQDRQRKLGGIITWYFDHVMESLPLMLQVALLLLGCALSRYLWEIDAIIARVVIGVTGFGVAFYIFVVVAGTAFVSCPYQTPWARIIRHIPHIFRRIRHILYRTHHILRHIRHIPRHIRHIPHHTPRGVLHRLLDFWSISVVPMLNVVHLVRSARARRRNQRTAVLESQCILWVLRTSLERGIRLSTLKFLATTPTLVGFTRALISDCFDILIDCIKVNEHNLVILQGMEQLAEASAMCFFLTYSHLSITYPMSGFLTNTRLRYGRVFPRNLNPGCLPFPHILGTLHEAIHRGAEVTIKWGDYEPTSHEHTAVAHALSKLSWSEWRWRQVPPLCLSFGLHYISQDSLPPTTVIAYCLLIIAIDLGCNVPKTLVLAERCVHV